MWNNVVKYLGKFPNAVLTGIDADGYPFSIRCMPQIDETRKILHILLAGDEHIQPGLAGILCHSHNEQLWDLKSFQILGKIEKTQQSWIFYPERFMPGGGLLGPITQMRSIFKARAEARRYLQKRGLPRPAIPWDQIKELRAESKNLR